MLLAREVEQRVEGIVAAVASAFSVFVTGRELGQSIPEAAISAVGISPAGQMTILDQSYLAGKLATQLGSKRVKRMSESEIMETVQRINLQITDNDRAIIAQLRNDTERWLTGRSEGWRQRFRTSLSQADRDWRAMLATGSAGTGADRALARNAMLRNLRDRLREDSAGFQADVDRLIQTEMHSYFQQGMVAEAPEDEIVYKVPRAGACRHCMRINLESDGSPKKYKLSEVAGNSNIGLPADMWTFTIGPVHPYCYCILFRESDEKAPGPNKRLRNARRERLSKSAEEPSSCGTVPAEMLFEEQPLAHNGHSHPIPAHQRSLIKAVKATIGENVTTRR